MESKLKNFISPYSLSLLVISIAIVISAYILGHQFIFLKKSGFIPHPNERRQLPKIITVDEIRPWMTFDYLNKQFDLPVNYFSEKLSISNPKYPNLSIEEFSEKSNISEEEGTFRVKSLIQGWTP